MIEYCLVVNGRCICRSVCVYILSLNCWYNIIVFYFPRLFYKFCALSVILIFFPFPLHTHILISIPSPGLLISDSCSYISVQLLVCYICLYWVIFMSSLCAPLLFLYLVLLSSCAWLLKIVSSYSSSSK